MQNPHESEWGLYSCLCDCFDFRIGTSLVYLRRDAGLNTRRCLPRPQPLDLEQSRELRLDEANARLLFTKRCC